MSLINQVLNELEKRGADAPVGGAAIRAVPAGEQRRPQLLLVLSVGIAAVMLAVWAWYGGRERGATHIVATAPEAINAPVVAGAASAVTESASAPEAADATAYSAALNMSYDLSPHPAAAPVFAKPLLKVAPEEASAPVPKKTAVREQSAVENVEKAAKPAADDAAPRSLKRISPQQHAENEFRDANLALQEGRTEDALAGYAAVLRHDPLHHAARRALVGVLLGLKRSADGERVLQEGLRLDVHESSFAMLLARLQVERDAGLALETLQKYLPHAEGRADYQAFVAALLQRQNRHKEAVTHFQIALQLAPGSGVWLMGLGISLQAVQRNEDARDAYRRALASNSLDAQLQAFVQKKLKEL